MTPEYIEQLADLVDPRQLWRLSWDARQRLPSEDRQRLDVGVALRRHAAHRRELLNVLALGRSLVITPTSPNGTAHMTIDPPPQHARLLGGMHIAEAAYRLNPLKLAARPADAQQDVAPPPAAVPLPEIECEEFYNLMQAYRHSFVFDQAATVEKYEAVKDWISAYGDAVRAEAYAAGWRACASWAKRDDLLADIDSPAYVAEFDAAIRSAPPAP